jgi:transaldolase
MHSIHQLRALGQSVWLDYLDRALLASGQLDTLIARDGLAGMTSNPTIFQKAIAGSSAYDDTILSAPSTEPDAAVLERIEVLDVARACDRFRGLYDDSGGADGFVSIEVSPELAHDTEKTITEVKRLWTSVSRPNLMVKIPGTREGLPAIEHCLREGIHINVTLLFSVARYVEVALAHRRALAARAAQAKRIDDIASVASFFVSRIDTKIDKALDAAPEEHRAAAKELRGKIAIANAKVAYQQCLRLMAEDDWQSLASKGARAQRLLWGSTSTKDPAYPDIYYAEALVGPGTVDTMTMETFRAYIDHGHPETRLTQSVDIAYEELAALSSVGVDLDKATKQLEDEGVRAFAESHDKSLAMIAERRRARRAS